MKNNDKKKDERPKSIEIIKKNVGEMSMQS